MLAFRIADRRHAIFDPTGAFLQGGRCNSAGKRVHLCGSDLRWGSAGSSRACQSWSRSQNPSWCRNHHPERVSAETVTGAELEAWVSADLPASRRFGDQWLDERRSAVLLVPSVALQGREVNVLINPDHPDFARIEASSPEAVVWDPRFFLGRAEIGEALFHLNGLLPRRKANDALPLVGGK